MENYQDWIYIAGVVLAFFVFLVWNKKNHGNGSRLKNRKTFKERIQERKKDH
jgi:hypothetical protein